MNILIQTTAELSAMKPFNDNDAEFLSDERREPTFPLLF